MAIALSDEERAAVAACLTAKRRREVEVSRRLMRYGLREFLGVPGDALEWRDTGPRCTDARHNVQLSAAHSRRHAAAAWSTAGAIGVDVENLDARLRWRRIMNAMFCDEDVNWITRGRPDNEAVGLRRFLTVWTAREAHAKYRCGSVLEGLSRPLLRDASAPGGDRYPRGAARVEVVINEHWVLAVCRPLRASMPVCLAGTSGSLTEISPQRADFAFIAGESH